MLTQRIKEASVLLEYNNKKQEKIIIKKENNSDNYRTLIGDELIETGGIISYTRLSNRAIESIPTSCYPFFFENPTCAINTASGFIKNSYSGNYSSCSTEDINNMTYFRTQQADLFTYLSYNSLTSEEKNKLDKLFPLTFPKISTAVPATVNRPGILQINHTCAYDIYHTFYLSTDDIGYLPLKRTKAVRTDQNMIIIKLVAKIPQTLKMVLLTSSYTNQNALQGTTNVKYAFWVNNSKNNVYRTSTIYGTGDWAVYTIIADADDSSYTADNITTNIYLPRIKVVPADNRAVDSTHWYLAYASCIVAPTAPIVLNLMLQNYSPFENVTSIKNGYIISGSLNEADAGSITDLKKRERIILKKKSGE